MKCTRDFFGFSGAEILPQSQWNLGAFLANFEKNPNLQFYHYFFFENWDFHSVNVNTHTSYMVTFSFNLIAIVCVIANCFFIDKNDLIMHFNKFPNLGVYHSNFPNLKGPRAPSKISKNNPCVPKSHVLTHIVNH